MAGSPYKLLGMSVYPLLVQVRLTQRKAYVVIRTRDRGEGLEHVLVEDTLWVLRRLVGHEAVLEGERRLRHCNAGEGKV